MSRARARFRARLCGVLVMAGLGTALVPESPMSMPIGEGVARGAAMGSQAALRGRGSMPTRASRCVFKPAPGFHPSLADTRWERRIEQLLGRHHIGVAASVGGEITFARDARRERVPASNQKLLLSLALFDRLGPYHRIATRAAAEQVEGGAVRGDLWLVGRGDPSLTAAEPGYWGSFRATTLRDLAARIKDAGVVRIEGSVRGAIGYFAHDFDAPGWQTYVPGRYVQLPTALVLNGNNIGRLPERAAAAALTKELGRVGVDVWARPSAGEPPAGLGTVAEVSSRPLHELVSFMNHSSNNFFAEVLGKLLGASAYGSPGTIDKGARAITAWVRRHREHAAANDSSGLSYRNRISPRSVVRLLSVAAAKPWIRQLRRGLPSAGEGTLGYRLAGLDVHAKTGSLFNGASTLSGWVRSQRSGRWVAFSILGRHVPSATEDRIVGVLARAPVRVPPPRPLPGCSDDASRPARAEARPSPVGTAGASTRVVWHRSTALGTHTAGRLVRGVKLPAEGRHFFTWDPVLKTSPNRDGRLWGTDRAIRIVLRVLEEFAAAHPDAARVGIGDISRPHGGDFGPQFGGLGHSSHQNGLDVDLYYPRRDGRERAPRATGQIDLALAQDLVDRFVRAGARFVFVGPSTGLGGPSQIVQRLAHHDDHMHIRFPLTQEDSTGRHDVRDSNRLGWRPASASER
jgi:D-alanyl-D-alanine carboxypeptidase/D-alanyl-D-alanine-endopeptidase (penicillin-binding protein 4)